MDKSSSPSDGPPSEDSTKATLASHRPIEKKAIVPPKGHQPKSTELIFSARPAQPEEQRQLLLYYCIGELPIRPVGFFNGVVINEYSRIVPYVLRRSNGQIAYLPFDPSDYNMVHDLKAVMETNVALAHTCGFILKATGTAKVFVYGEIARGFSFGAPSKLELCGSLYLARWTPDGLAEEHINRFNCAIDIFAGIANVFICDYKEMVIMFDREAKFAFSEYASTAPPQEAPSPSQPPGKGSAKPKSRSKSRERKRDRKSSSSLVEPPGGSKPEAHLQGQTTVQDRETFAAAVKQMNESPGTAAAAGQPGYKSASSKSRSFLVTGSSASSSDKPVKPAVADEVAAKLPPVEDAKEPVPHDDKSPASTTMPSMPPSGLMPVPPSDGPKSEVKSTASGEEKGPLKGKQVKSQSPSKVKPKPKTSKGKKVAIKSKGKREADKPKSKEMDQPASKVVPDKVKKHKSRGASRPKTPKIKTAKMAKPALAEVKPKIKVPPAPTEQETSSSTSKSFISKSGSSKHETKEKEKDSGAQLRIKSASPTSVGKVKPDVRETKPKTPTKGKKGKKDKKRSKRTAGTKSPSSPSSPSTSPASLIGSKASSTPSSSSSPGPGSTASQQFMPPPQSPPTTGKVVPAEIKPESIKKEPAAKTAPTAAVEATAAVKSPTDSDAVKKPSSKGSTSSKKRSKDSRKRSKSKSKKRRKKVKSKASKIKSAKSGRVAVATPALKEADAVDAPETKSKQTPPGRPVTKPKIKIKADKKTVGQEENMTVSNFAGKADTMDTPKKDDTSPTTGSPSSSSDTPVGTPPPRPRLPGLPMPKGDPDSGRKIRQVKSEDAGSKPQRGPLADENRPKSEPAITPTTSPTSFEPAKQSDISAERRKMESELLQFIVDTRKGKTPSSKEEKADAVPVPVAAPATEDDGQLKSGAPKGGEQKARPSDKTQKVKQELDKLVRDLGDSGNRITKIKSSHSHDSKSLKDTLSDEEKKEMADEVEAFKRKMAQVIGVLRQLVKNITETLRDELLEDVNALQECSEAMTPEQFEEYSERIIMLAKKIDRLLTSFKE